MRVTARHFVDGQTVMNVLPILWYSVSWMDAERFDGIDGLEDFLDLGPAGEAQEDCSTGAHMRNSRIALTWCHGAQDVDARDNRTVVVRCPADEGEDAARGE